MRGSDRTMDMMKYFGLTHVDHTVLNPLSLAKTLELVDLLRLPEGGRVVDIACGKAELLCLLAERYDVTGTGVEVSSIRIHEALENIAVRGLGDHIELLHMDGADYAPERGESLDLASCVGGSWIHGGHAKTLEALVQMAKPGGLVLVGEPFWITEPVPEYLALIGEGADMCGTHSGNVQAGVDLGLSLLYTVVSAKDDWDRYEGLQWQAAERWAAAHPDDPDVAEVLRISRENREGYVRWGRDCLGWAMYLFRKADGPR